MKGFLPRLVLFSIFILFVSIYPVKAAAPAAVVGSGEVSEQDISDWQAAQSCYGADAITSRKAGFMRMFEATILEQVLGGQAARPITREEYSREVARIDAETRAPDILGCIKKYFGDNTDRYERIFVRPILAQRFIHELVKYSPAVQAHAYALRDKISTDVVKGVPFRDKIGRAHV